MNTASQSLLSASVQSLRNSPALAPQRIQATAIRAVTLLIILLAALTVPGFATTQNCSAPNNAIHTP